MSLAVSGAIDSLNRRLTLTRKIGVLLVLPLAGAFAGVATLWMFMVQTKGMAHFVNVAGRQRMLAAELQTWVDMVASGQEADRPGLAQRMADFQNALAALQRGGFVMDDKVEAAPRSVQPALAAVESCWLSLVPSLQTVVSSAVSEPRFREAQAVIKTSLADLKGLSHQVLKDYMTWRAVLRRQMSVVLVAIAVFSLGVFLAGVFVTRRYIVRPVLRINEVAKHIADGDFSQRLLADTGDELATLAEGFNQMADRVRGLLETLERRRQGAEAVATQARAFEARFRGILERATDGVILMGADGRIAYVNESAQRMFGYSADDLTGKKLTELMPEKYRVRHEEGLARYLATGTSEILGSVQALEGLRRHGAVFPLELAVSSYRAGDDEMFAAILRDVTQQKELAARMMQMDRAIAAGTLAAGVAHEVNNPLTIVAGNLELLATDLEDLSARIARPDGASRAEERLLEMRQSVAAAITGAERVRRIVGDLKLFCKTSESERHPVDLSKVLASSAEVAINQIRHRARLVKRFGAAPTVLGTESQLGQVFLNLLVNACQAIAEGRADENEITLQTLTDQAGRAVVEVRDTGCGIPADVLPRIFDPFFTTRDVGQGTGLGLSVCRGIVRDLGGEIEVETEVGKGSVFRVVLPAAPAESAPRPVATSAPGPGERGRLLLVDDEPLIGQLLRRVLAPDHDVVYVATVREALERLSSERFDLVLSDLMMPDLTGMDLHAKLQEQMPEQARKMVFLSGGIFTEAAERFLARVPNLCLAKPVEPGTLRKTVREQLERHRSAG